jgi:hypothetical protein
MVFGVNLFPFHHLLPLPLLLLLLLLLLLPLLPAAAA